MKRNSLLHVSALGFTAIFALGGYNCNDVLRDPGFDLWCEDRLCAWDLEVGEIRQVPTWHESDVGVEMLGSEVAISQFANRSSDDLTCLRFELIADIEETASVTLELDFFGDGTVEHEQVIPTSNWAQLSYRIKLPPAYQGILFRLRKRGSGRAVLAEIAALSEDDCGDLPGLEAIAHPNGASCEEGDMCLGGQCIESAIWVATCGDCVDGGDCNGGQVCGLETVIPGHLWPYQTCVAPASHGLGERCVNDAECATGICTDQVCSTCADDNDCATDERCAARQLAEAPEQWNLPPWQCEPGAGTAASGTACLDDSDCQSGVCNGFGERRVCLFDSRTCFEDGDCPLAEAGSCINIGLADGTCQ